MFAFASILDRKLLRDLWRIKGQAAAIVFVIAAGISLFVMSHGMMISLDETMRAYYERYRFADMYAPAKRAPDYIIEELSALAGVNDVEGRISGGGLVTLPDESAPISARVLSFDPEAVSPINGVHLSEGRMISPTRNDEILLLKSFADAHELKPGDSLSVTMNGVRHKFTIAGLALSPEFIYALPPGEFVVDNGRFAALWLNEDAMEAAYDLDGAFNEAVLTFSPYANEDFLITELDRILAPYGATGAYSRADQISNKFLVEELAQLKTMGRVMPPIFVAVSIFLLNIVVTRLVQTEREQIGLIKAFGYSNRDVAVHYLKFVLAIALGGALVGWGGGVWLGRMIGEIYRLYFHFPFLVFIADFSTLGIALAISALSAAAGAFFAVRSAVVLTPAVAMRPPAPPKFASGNGVLKAVSRLLDQPSRMILRRLSREPARALLTAFGIGAAMGLSVMMRFNVNATDYMLDVSFNVIDRSDVFVSFVEPLSDKTILELESIDGVTLVEPVRSTPVMFKHDRIEYLGSITGLPEDAALNRAVDSDLQDVDITGNGVVLSEQLAEILNIAPGDTLTVEVREGRRPTLDIPVTGIVEALIGTPAYMDMDALNRQLKEPNRVSGAYLKIDPRMRQAVYNEIKAIPKVAGVSLRREAYENFQKMIDEGPGVFRYIMTVFSIVIAAGVVYNSARIAYIERERDLASLRVLGFTKIETGYVLLGELGTLAIIALPIGSALGYLIWSYMATAMSTDLYQIPVIYKEDGLGYAAIIVLLATAFAGAFIQRDVSKIDMASALKTRD
ncbi:ABC transporter permease [Hyphococcus luteus]|uniref:ABC transporter permease n=1 Tax=Hyphococcus luteus TaxID=2058213 RepID=A0A2S7K3X2_9PROT|nr:FtsX-like permease family protein [Marinicaulis flavus]PQA87210.1 ABC transporter permease [Marinicaulis flavus]